MSRKNSEERDRVFAEEAAVVQAQLLLHDLMKDRGWSRADLARAMNVSRARVTQIFSDECANLTIRLLSRALVALGEEFELSTRNKAVCAGSVDLAQIGLEACVAAEASRAWVQIDDYASRPLTIANDNIFGGLASLRLLREEGYELAA